MIAAMGLRWTLTVLFGLLTLYGIWRVAVSGHDSAAGRVAHGLHTVMALAMGVMVWPEGMDLPAWPQVVFFSLAALWFVAVGTAAPGALPRSRALRAALPHVLVMGAMAWMVYAMSSTMSVHAGSGGTGSMPGMDMSGGSAISSMTLHGGGERATAGVLTIVLLAFALGWLARAFDIARMSGAPGDRNPDRRTADNGAWDLGCHGAMAFGMAVMFALLI